MGRRSLIKEKQHPFYFQAAAPQPAPAETTGISEGPGTNRMPEQFLEMVMEGLSDACLLLEGNDRIVYVNGAAKTLLQPRGRILGRRLVAVLADRQLSMLAADSYHTGKPIFTELKLTMPGNQWRIDHSFHVSIVPLPVSATKRLLRIALRETGPRTAAAPGPQKPSEAPEAAPNFGDAVLQMKNPLSILQGYLENLLDGVVKDPVALRQSLVIMKKHTTAIEKLLDSFRK